MNRTVLALLAFVIIVSALGESTKPTRIRITTWNLEWFPSGSTNEASAAQQNQRIKEAADVLRPIDPDIILLQEVRDYDSCVRLGEAIAPGIIASQFALHLRNRSRAVWENSKSRFYPNIKRKQRDQNLGGR